MLNDIFGVYLFSFPSSSDVSSCLGYLFFFFSWIYLLFVRATARLSFGCFSLLFVQLGPGHGSSLSIFNLFYPSSSPSGFPFVLTCSYRMTSWASFS